VSDTAGTAENAYSVARREAEGRTDFVDLINTNFPGCGFRIPRRTKRRIVAEYTRHEKTYEPNPAGDAALRRAIAGYYRSRPEGADLPPSGDAVIVTASASESYSHVFAATCKPGDRILLPRPGYPLFEDIANRFGLQVSAYDLAGDHGWTINAREIESKIEHGIKALVIISPNNPTGTVLDRQNTIEIGALCRRHGVFLIADEVFSEFVYNGAKSPWIGGMLSDVPVYTINGMSKLYAAPDLKVSWALVTGSEASARIGALHIVNDMYLSATPLSQFVAAKLLGSGLAFTRAMVAEIGRRRTTMLDEISKTPGLSAPPPSGGIHLPVAVDPDLLPSGTDDERLSVELLRRGVATHPGYFYGIETPVTVVMSYLSPQSVIIRGFERIRTYLSETRS
jgi:aspartate/methionine/tyrosine aminotransferase